MPRDFEYEDFSSVPVEIKLTRNIPFEQIIENYKLGPFTDEQELVNAVEDYLNKHGFRAAELTESTIRSLLNKLTIYFVQRINKGE